MKLRKILLGILITLIFVSFHVTFNEGKPHDYNFIWPKWFVAYGVMSVLLGLVVVRKYGIIVATALSYSVINAAYLFSTKYNMYEILQICSTNTYKGLASIGLNSLLLFALPIMLLKYDYIKTICQTVGILAPINALIVIYEYITDQRLMGFNGNPSINAGVMVLSLPMIYMLPGNKVIKHLLSFVTLAGIYCSDSSIPIGMLGILIVTYILFDYLKNNKVSIKVLLTIIMLCFTIALIVGVTGYVFVGKSFFNSSGRFEFWSKLVPLWFDRLSMGFKANYWFGSGLSTAALLVPSFQQALNIFRGVWFGFVHNDWLQWCFEMGYVGVGLYAAVYVQAIVKSLKRPDVLALVLAWLPMSLLNWPTHHAVSALITVLIFRLAYQKELV